MWQKPTFPRALTVYPQAQVTLVRHGIPWLEFLVYPDHRRVKARNVYNFRRRLRERWQEYCAGAISFAEFDASVQGWINASRSTSGSIVRRRSLGQPVLEGL